MPFTLRPVCPNDEAFLFELYSSTRMDELAMWGWTASQQEAFLRMQFTAQQQHYRTQFPHADERVIVLDSRPIGRIIIMRWDDEIRLVDIALLPEHRNVGIGTALIQDMLDEARQSVKPVRLHVLKYSRAIRLYERLGFSKIGDTGTHFLMEWSPEAPKSVED